MNFLPQGPEKNKATSRLTFGPSLAFHPPGLFFQIIDDTHGLRQRTEFFNH